MFSRISLVLLCSASLASITPAALAESTVEAVKMSKSGICHDTSSKHYQRVKHFEPFESMQACLDAGGREPKN
jgi:hypothetical protein